MFNLKYIVLKINLLISFLNIKYFVKEEVVNGEMLPSLPSLNKCSIFIFFKNVASSPLIVEENFANYFLKTSALKF